MKHSNQWVITTTYKTKFNKATASDLGLDLSRVYNNYEEMAKVESALSPESKIEAAPFAPSLFPGDPNK